MVSAERTGAFVATPREAIAPWWHTVLVVVPIAIGSITSWYQHGLPNANLPGISPRLSSYFTVLAIEWFPVLLIWLALRRRGLSVSTLVSGRWQTLGMFFKDLGLAVGFLVVVVPLVGILASLLGGVAETAVANITPKTGFELMVWLALAATGSFCEELVFRGYLTQQFNAWTGSCALAVVLQGDGPHNSDLVKPRVLPKRPRGVGSFRLSSFSRWMTALLLHNRTYGNARARRCCRALSPD